MSRRTENPLLHSARREAVATLLVWLCALIYTAGYCTTYGYGREVESLTFVWGFPDWIFWGVIVPWGVCYLISAVFAFAFIQDAPLEDEPEAAEEVSRD